MPRRIPVGPFPHYYAIVDDEDYEDLSQFKWFPAKRGNNIYARRNVGGRHKVKNGPSLMHKMITAFDRTDHTNGIGLDNRKENLRSSSHSENLWNMASHLDSRSRFKGVSFNQRKGLWIAEITCNRNRYFLGYFTEETQAAKAYDAKAVELFGAFARINLP